MITKHEEHPCKECDMKLTTFMDLLQHVAKHHLKEGKVNDEDEAELGKDKEKEPGNQDVEPRHGTKANELGICSVFRISRDEVRTPYVSICVTEV